MSMLHSKINASGVRIRMRRSRVSIDPISAAHSSKKDQHTVSNKLLSPQAFDKLVIEEITHHEEKLRTQAVNPGEKKSLPLTTPDKNNAIEALIEEALAQVPESERKIWASMKEELGL